MNWKVAYLPEAEKDLKDLDGSQRLLVLNVLCIIDDQCVTVIDSCIRPSIRRNRMPDAAEFTDSGAEIISERQIERIAI